METIEKLGHYLANELSPEEAAALERELAQDATLQQTLDSLQISRRAVQIGAIQTEVRQAHDQFMAQLRAERIEYDRKSDGATIIPLSSQTRSIGLLGWVVRVAAGVLLVMIGYGSYQMATLDGQAIYNEKFVSYQLSTTRGTDDPPSPLEARYRAGNFAGVIEQAGRLPVKQIPDYFLTGMAYLQLKQYQLALTELTQVQQANRQRIVPYFAPETEYYQALTYLGAKQYRQAYARLETIYKDPSHPYHMLVTKVDLWKIRALSWKE